MTATLTKYAYNPYYYIKIASLSSWKLALSEEQIPIHTIDILSHRTKILKGPYYISAIDFVAFSFAL